MVIIALLSDASSQWHQWHCENLILLCEYFTIRVFSFIHFTIYAIFSTTFWEAQLSFEAIKFLILFLELCKVRFIPFFLTFSVSSSLSFFCHIFCSNCESAKLFLKATKNSLEDVGFVVRSLGPWMMGGEWWLVVVSGGYGVGYNRRLSVSPEVPQENANEMQEKS